MDEALGMNVKIKFAQGGILCMTLHNDPDPPDFEAIYRDWDAYDAQQQEALAATEKAEKAEAI